MTSRSVTSTRAHVADALTASRFLLALIVVPLAADGSWLLAAVVVVVAWWTDYLDGRLARTAAGTRLGDWDHHADTAVGVGLVVGLAVGDHVPAVAWLVLGLGSAAVFLVTANFAFGELAQAAGYAPLLWYSGKEDLLALGLLVATIAAIGVLDRKRLTAYTLPVFFEGMNPGRWLRR